MKRMINDNYHPIEWATPEYYQIRVMGHKTAAGSHRGTRNLLKSLMRDRIKRFINGSTMFDPWQILTYMAHLAPDYNALAQVVTTKMNALYNLSDAMEIVRVFARDVFTELI